MTDAPEPTSEQMSDEDRSKDEFFVKLAQLGNDMIAAHGNEFAMGVFILAARFIAEGKPLNKSAGDPASGIAEAK